MPLLVVVPALYKARAGSLGRVIHRRPSTEPTMKEKKETNHFLLVPSEYPASPTRTWMSVALT